MVASRELWVENSGGDEEESILRSSIHEDEEFRQQPSSPSSLRCRGLPQLAETRQSRSGVGCGTTAGSAMLTGALATLALVVYFQIGASPAAGGKAPSEVRLYASSASSSGSSAGHQATLHSHSGPNLTEAEKRAIEAKKDAQKEDLIVETFGSMPDFVWGIATSAYQVEGAWNQGGRSESIWDVFCHEGRAFKASSGDEACNYYYNFRSDLDLVSQYGFGTYRFSISWTRVLPFVDGRMTPNPEGIRFYKEVLDVLRAKGIKPMVTIFHWDLPKQLDWRKKEVVDYYLQYAQFVLDTFPEVEFWATFNEPFSFCFLGYGLGIHAPGIWSKHDHYKCGHHVLLAHAKTLELYKNRWAPGYGQIGMVINYDFAFPKDPDNPHDVRSVEWEAQTRIGWFADPLYFGDYPEVLRKEVGEHLPNFTDAEKQLLIKNANHPMTYYGLNTYGGRYMHAAHNNSHTREESFYKDGKPIGIKSIGAWLYEVPEEIFLHLHWVNDRYAPRKIHITENGVADPGNTMYDYTVNDYHRISFYRNYLAKVAEAVRQGVPVAGYFAWALLDNFEWADGYKRRFGLTYVDFGTQKRTPKKSAFWWTGLLGRLR